MTQVVDAPVIVVPPIEVDFPYLVHPYVHDVEAHVVEWAQRYNLIRSLQALRRLEAARFGYFVACVYPLSQDLSVAAEWNTWLFMFDDQFDDADPARQAGKIGTLFPEILRMLPEDLAATARPSCGIVAAIADWWATTAPRMTPAWRTRFVGHVSAYLESYRSETANRLDGRPPDLRTYIDLRRSTGAVATSLALIEAASSFTLPETVVRNKGFQDLCTAANDIICWHNDIISANKELARGEVNNLLVVIRHAGCADWESSVRQAIAMVTRRWHEFLDIERRLHDESGLLRAHPEYVDRVRHCTAAMKYWISGSLHWHLTTKRYSEVEYFRPGQEPGYLDPLLPAATTQ